MPQSKLNGCYKVSTINMWVVALVKKNELQEIDRTHKLIAMNKLLYAKSDMSRLSVKRKGGQ